MSSKCTILIAEDDLPTQKLLRALMQRSGFATAEVASASEAIAQLEANHFDAVILDLMMRESEGRTVLAHLSARPTPPPVVICTPLSAQQIGAVDERVVRAIIRKPFDIEQLITTVQTLAGAPPDERAQVLIVDDNVSFRYVMRAFIERADATEAESGEAALDAMRARKPDVVLLDLNLPGISGEEVLERITNDPAMRDTPVVVVTSRPLEEAERQALLGKVSAVMNKRDLSRASLNAAVTAAIAASKTRPQ